MLQKSVSKIFKRVKICDELDSISLCIADETIKGNKIKTCSKDSDVFFQKYFFKSGGKTIEPDSSLSSTKFTAIHIVGGNCFLVTEGNNCSGNCESKSNDIFCPASLLPTLNLSCKSLYLLQTASEHGIFGQTCVGLNVILPHVDVKKSFYTVLKCASVVLSGMGSSCLPALFDYSNLHRFKKVVVENFEDLATPVFDPEYLRTNLEHYLQCLKTNKNMGVETSQSSHWQEEQSSGCLKMAEERKIRVHLDMEDRPPASYYQPDALCDLPLKKAPFQTPQADEWVKAPAFVPRSMLEESFNSPCDVIGAPQSLDNNLDVPFAPFCGDYTTHFPSGTFPSPLPMFPQARTVPPIPADLIPEGYSANITHINSGVGPPIPAIVLRKKRRKRNRQTNSMVLNSSESPGSSQPRTTATPDQKNLTEEEEEFRINRAGLGGSCPDLSEEQLEMWDNYLYDTAVASNKEPQDFMKTSAYEIIPRGLLDLAEQHIDGISNPELRKLDREINGNSMTASMVMQRLSNHTKHLDSAASTERSLASEFEQLHFRPEATRYGYPQIDSENVHLTTVHHGSVHSKIVPRSKLRRQYSDSEEEDCFEGNIRINAFDPCEELSLTDTESASTNRFEQIQQAIRRGTELRPPDRVCCSIQ